MSFGFIRMHRLELQAKRRACLHAAGSQLVGQAIDGDHRLDTVAIENPRHFLSAASLCGDRRTFPFQHGQSFVGNSKALSRDYRRTDQSLLGLLVLIFQRDPVGRTSNF